ncbi:MAG: hypothetical protein M1135_00250 [Candidatus Omnitrophica bacterium]|jgi:hypothetical protein|nr:hypothetical protein [Candidatus Omnitrophota bacterium]
METKILNEFKRLPITYTKKIIIPAKYQKFIWDKHPKDKKIILEKLIQRILTYGNYNDIKWIFQKYPEETYTISLKYPDIKRGVKFWIKYWYEK